MMASKMAVAATMMSGNGLFKTLRFATTRSPAEQCFLPQAALCGNVLSHARPKHSNGSAERGELMFRQEMERKPSVAVVFHHIGPYHHVRLNAAADRLTVTALEWSAKASEEWGAAD